MDRTLASEWAYACAWDFGGERAGALPEYLAYYDHDRPHSAYGGLPPMSRMPDVNNVLASNI